MWSYPQISADAGAESPHTGHMITPSRRDNADGTTVWVVRFRYGTSKKTGKPKQTSELFESQAKAKTFAGWIDALGPQGALDMLYESEQVAEVPSLDEVAADHIEHLTGIEEGTRKKYTALWARTWGKHIGSLPANAWGPDNVRSALNLLALDYAPKSLMNQRGLLSGVADRCIEKGYLTKSPTKKLRLPQGKHVEVDDDDDGDPTEMVCLTHIQWKRLYEQFAEHYKAFIRFLVGTGCRWGEAVVLRVRDVDLTQGVIRIRRALKWSPDGKRTIGPPKTKKGKRSIQLPPEVAIDLRTLIKGKGPNELVFEQTRGGMVNHRNFWSRYWKPGIFRAQHCDEHLAELVEGGCKCGTTTPARCTLHKDAGQPAPCGCPGTLREAPRIHDLRHTSASWALAIGTPIHVVQARLGHESIQTTVDTYSHLLPDAQIMAAQAASMMFSAVGPSSGLPPMLVAALKAAIDSGALRSDALEVVAGELVAA